MCDYTKVTYQCGHVRYLVKAWYEHLHGQSCLSGYWLILLYVTRCVRYQQTHERCPPNVVAK